MGDVVLYVYVLLGTIVALYFIYWNTHPLSSIPTIGPSLPLLSYLGAYRYYHNAREMLLEGYKKHKTFKVPLLAQWLVVVSGSEMNEELRKVPDTHASFMQAANDVFLSKYTMAPDINDHPIHINVIRGALTRNLGVLFGDILDEIRIVFPEAIPAHDDDWIPISVLHTMAHVISRASNRIFVGVPLCRDPEYLSLVLNYAFDVSRARDILELVPGFVGLFLPWSRRALRRMAAYITPIIRERQRYLDIHGGDWPDKPNDFIMWMIEEARKTGKDINLIVQAVLVSNFAAIHTSSHSLTHAIYDLAHRSEYLQPLREEVRAVVAEHGWTKLAIGKMWKLDSFMRESQRVNGISGISVMRKILQDTTLRDGTYLPKGTLVVAAAHATHLDSEHYKNPNVFDGFRFSDKRTEGKQRIKHQYVNTSAEFVAFGNGKHACPGRFFAVNEIKTMMAYILLNYDFKFEDGVGRPENKWIWHSIFPSNTKVLFRRRKIIPN
ncbi:uncharacterized protein FIBRA_00062 [Fibroporia radiculosa]|uniref:Cytochrome P450 n=1 Tax=Fibroporia radiculosa TaxID=599839 RepID=J7SCF3_9APHY|nr:uncharacterized protein FIBRA_00062 [Fibroporia radiculosa]CCL98068.1 predicted protein [Fibroporia radiculosa]